MDREYLVELPNGDIYHSPEPVEMYQIFSTGGQTYRVRVVAEPVGGRRWGHPDRHATQVWGPDYEKARLIVKDENGNELESKPLFQGGNFRG